MVRQHRPTVSSQNRRQVSRTVSLRLSWPGRAPGRVEHPTEKTEWFPADFASEFLAWIAAEYPDCAGATISSADIAASFFPRFQAATCRHHLTLGALLRGLGQVAKPRPYKYLDRTGRRRNGTEYQVPRPRRHSQGTA
jgi:hypothetical protein